MLERRAAPLPGTRLPAIGGDLQTSVEFTPLPFTAEGFNRLAKSLHVAGQVQDLMFKRFEARLETLESLDRS